MNETLLLLLRLAEVRRQKLKCDEAVELGVLGFINHTNATFA